MSLEAGDGVTDTTSCHHNEDQDGVTRSHDGVRAHDPSHYLEYSLYTRRHHHDTCDGVTKTLTTSNGQVIFDKKKLESS
ncbi:hypothetical protein Tco_1297612 [Tanacetum coccineum]